MIGLVNLIGVILAAVIIWWFLIAKPKATQVVGEVVDILVKNGVYEPALIKAKKGQKLTLRFFRADDTPCAEMVIFETLNKSAQLPLNQPHELTLTLKKAGAFEFTCQMGMYRGKLIVV